MTPAELKEELIAVVRNKITDPLLILGKSGIGKSSIIEQVGLETGYPILADVRWGQMAPADVRGVPVPDHVTKLTEFYPPKFWPTSGPGIILLDEFNMASPVMMGLAQQLLLDRKFGDYSVPKDVLVWAAGNRKTDKAAVSSIPGPVLNRVAHYEVEEDIWSFKIWGYGIGVNPLILGFLDRNSQMLHKPSIDEKAWPSPRTWWMAHKRLAVGMKIAPVVGQAVEDEFEAHVRLAATMPNIDLIEKGLGSSVNFPDEPSIRYAMFAEIIARSLKSWDSYINCVKWAIDKCGDEPDWVAMAVQDVLRLLAVNNKPKQREYLGKLMQIQEIKKFVAEMSAAGGLT